MVQVDSWAGAAASLVEWGCAIRAADAGGKFVPNTGMLRNLFFCLDVEQAAASFEEDRVRILGDIKESPGFAAVRQ